MEKKFIGMISLILIIGLVFLSGCGKPNQSQASYIGIEEARRIALEDAKVQAADAACWGASLDERNGVEYYDIDFVSGGMKIEYDIDAMTGVIIDLKKQEASQDELQEADAVLAEAGGANAGMGENAAAGQTGGAAGNQQTNQGGGNASVSGQSGAQGGDIGAEKAKEIALKDAGLSASGVTFVQTKLDYEDGRRVYEVEFYTADYKEYDYEIDAASGTILSKDYDAEYYAGQGAGAQSGQSSKTAISEAKAKDIALGKVSGATNSNLVKFKTDYDDGRMKYEGTILYNEMEYDFEIDAFSGTVLEWGVESIYD